MRSAPVRRTLAALLCAALLLSTVQAQLPSLGDGSEMTLGAERKMGDRIARELYRDPDYIDDPVLGEYVQDIWKALLAAARVRGELSAELSERFAWEVLLGRDRTVNAFALPGGYMGLNLGLISIVTNRDELASVLGHELSHVTQRHISRLTTKQNQQAPLMIAAMILGALAASKSPEAANALMTGGTAVGMQNQLNFSRDMEREADRIGYGVMTQAGFEPQGFVTMFDKLQQASRLSDNGAFPYLRSHPLTTERIADIQARHQLPGRSVPAVPSAEQAMISARARVLSGPGVDVLRTWVAEASASVFAGYSVPRKAGVLYAAALASVSLREFREAQRLAAQLTSLPAQEPGAARLTRLLSVEVDLAAGLPASAVALAPTSASASARPELMLSSRALIAAGRAAEAAQALQTWTTLHPRDASAWELLSGAYAGQGQQLRAIRADAEAQVAIMDYPAAMDRFKAAQDLMRRSTVLDHIEASIID
ncbi:MAG: M48 family metalloprotease, partial [Burkholderiaceae bacterium]|nr:M48 family metalloprotease [Burkholderiaceae bacterium]